MRLLRFQVMFQPRQNERLGVLWVENFIAPGKGGELLKTSSEHRFNQSGIFMAREIPEWRNFAVLLPHEQQRHERGQQGDSGGQFQSVQVDQRRQTFGAGAISYLIMILAADDKMLRRN